MTPLSDAAVRRLTTELRVPALPPRYQPREVIGRGGMGVVWRAWDALLERDVAVKVLAEHVAEDDWTARLAREARILARLEHPGIVAVHDVGMLDDGRAWYAMRLVRGESLAQAGAAPLTVGDVLRVMTRLCEAVAYAHSHGVIHRDLTPRNVMLGPFGEVLVLDWGTARPLGQPDRDLAGASDDGDGAVTAHGTVIGTPGYHAPEQAAGLVADVRSDVYGLGAILRDLIEAIPGGAPRPLAAIRDRALAVRPDERYDDATALRADLACFQDGAAVAAYRESLGERLSRVAAQYRTPIALVVAYLVMRLVVLVWRGI